MNFVRTFAGAAVFAGLLLSATGCELLTAPDRTKIDGSGGTGATGGGGSGTGATTTTSPAGGGGSGGTSSSSSGCVTPEDDMKECTDDACQPDGSTAHTPKTLGSTCTEGGGAVCDAAGACVECNVADDCNDATKTCDDTKCVDVTCTDAELNGSETDVDCGGDGCSPCEDDQKCLVGSDCESGVCDPGTLTCSSAACGDGVMQAGEVCDDDNTVDCDGCRADCSAVETGCGDGFKCGVEACDDDNTDNCDGCRADCSAMETGCGDGFTCGAEVCDDGNQTNGDGCDDGAGASCTVSGCGNGVVSGTEECDDMNMINGDGCDNNCTDTACGNGITAGAESCDDGDASGGDGCSATCTTEPGFNCTGTPSTCTTTCGDGITAGAEVCDDGDTDANDGCSALCAVEAGFTCTGTAPSTCASTCGDGIIVATETCDQGGGNVTPGDGCSATCTVEAGFTCTGTPSVCAAICGDGIKAGAETCDDSNTANNDCCSSTCQVEPGCETEVNNTCGAQNALPAFAGSPLATTIKGNIIPIADLDFYTFTLPGPGVQSVRIETFFGAPGTCGSVATNDTKVELRGTDCTTILATNEDGTGLGWCSLIEGGTTAAAKGLAAGTYSVRVARSPLGTQVVLLNYGLKVSILSTCGNGMVEPTEACDDANLAAGDGCSTTCTAESGFGCSGSPSVCVPLICGNGMLEPTQPCDDGNTTPGDGCSATCTLESGYTCTGMPSACMTTCGDGIKAGVETCDDGNLVNNDCCSSTCQVEAGCETEPNNVCGAANTLTLSGTPATGTISGVIKPLVDGDLYAFTLATRSSVRIETFVGGAGLCTIATNSADTEIELRAADCTTILGSDDDDGPSVCSLIDPTVAADTYARALAPNTYYVRVFEHANDALVNLYQLKVSVISTCGNGTVEPSENCDDGNATVGDGCSAVCATESGYTCSGVPSVCTLSICGNGVVENGESCDDTNTTAGDGCSATCATESGYTCSGSPSVCLTIACGNGVVQGSETCDDGNVTAGDGCSATCTIQTGYTCTGMPSVCVPNCGNGILNSGETCDQGGGNVTPGDGCSATCTVETGYTCTGTPSVCLLPEINCNDGLDNNGGGGIDALDPTCALPAYFTTCGAGETLLVIPSADTPKAIPDNNPAGTTSTINVTAGGTIARAALVVNVTHGWTEDIDLLLTAPNAATFDVSSDNGEDGDNYANTVFDSTCATPIDGALFDEAPFSDCYAPETSFASLVSLSPTGTWSLKASDDEAIFSGSLARWRLVLCTTP